MKLSALQCDPEAIYQGTWVDVETSAACPGPHATHFCVRVRPRGFSYHAKVEEIVARRPNADRKSDEVMDAIVGEALGLTCVTAWVNLEDSDGTAIPFSAAKAAEVLSDPRYRPIRILVELVSGREDLTRAKQEASAAKN